MKLFHVLIICFAAISAAVAQTTPKAPTLEFVMELRVTCDPSYTVGKTSHGERVVIPITGGTVSGPSIKGKVIPGGADYQLVDAENHRAELEAIYSIQTDDGVNIHIRNRGINCWGEDATGLNRFYFMTSPVFEAPETSKYNVLNNGIFVCKPYGGSDGTIVLPIWMVK